jgi:hypothetical protein
MKLEDKSKNGDDKVEERSGQSDRRHRVRGRKKQTKPQKHSSPRISSND